MTTSPLQESLNKIHELEEEILNLKSQLTGEKVSNLEFDLTSKETLENCEILRSKLENTVNQNKQLYELQLQLQAHIKTIENENREYQIKISECEEIIHTLEMRIKEQEIQKENQKQSMQQNIEESPTYSRPIIIKDKSDDEYDQYELHLGSERPSSNAIEIEEQNRQMRLELVDIQMAHEELKHIHRKSISKIESFVEEDDNGLFINKIENDLQKEISDMRRKVSNLEIELQKEKRKNDNLDKERRKSLAQLSQNMFKKLLDSEHEHYDQTIDLEVTCKEMQERICILEVSKQKLAMNTSNAINELRNMIWLMSTRLAVYENGKQK